MADKSAKLASNVAGKYYTDANCICCGQCGDTAPDFFAEDQDAGCFYVKAQPVSSADCALCDEAKNNCPVEAIGDDGE